MRRCPNCRRPVKDGDNLCSFCDESLEDRAKERTDSDPNRSQQNRSRDGRVQGPPAGEGAAHSENSPPHQPPSGQTPQSRRNHRHQPPQQQSASSQTPPPQDSRERLQQPTQQPQQTPKHTGQSNGMQRSGSSIEISRRTLLLTGGTVIAAAGGAYYLTQDGSVGPNSGPPVEDVDLNLADVRRPNFGVNSATLSLVFEIVNTNQSAEITSPTIDYNVFINQVEVLSTRETLSTLEPGNSRREVFEIVIDYSDFSMSLINALRNGQASLGVRGSVESGGNSSDFDLTYQF